MIDLSGKVAVITGAADTQGQGFASASFLAECGASVVLGDIRKGDVLDRAAELTERGFKAVAAGCDVREEEQVKALIRLAIDTFGGVDVLHAQAADLAVLADPGDPELAEVTVDGWRLQFETIVLGTLLACKHAIPAMLERGGGSIICTSSVSGTMGEPNLTVYAAAKAGVNQLVRSISSQYGHRGVRANAIAPGLILSAPGIALGQDLIDQYARHSDTGFVGGPSDTAHVVAFLASDLSRLITGEVIRVDGGYAQHSPMLAEQRASQLMVGGN